MNKSRKEIMLILLDLNNFMIEQYKIRFNKSDWDKYPELTASWLDEKFDRFHLVESTTHSEEDFTVNIELRYTLRSQEASRFGNKHQVFYDRYLSTTKVPISAIENPEAFKEEVLTKFAEV